MPVSVKTNVTVFRLWVAFITSHEWPAKAARRYKLSRDTHWQEAAAAELFSGAPFTEQPTEKDHDVHQVRIIVAHISTPDC